MPIRRTNHEIRPKIGNGYGGGRGIRTLDTVSRIHALQACAFDHSATPPERSSVAIPATRSTGSQVVLVRDRIPSTTDVRAKFGAALAGTRCQTSAVSCPCPRPGNQRSLCEQPGQVGRTLAAASGSSSPAWAAKIDV